MAHLYWQDAAAEGSGEAVRDAGAAAGILDGALQLSESAERLFRGEEWSNPAVLYMDVLDAAQCLTARGCDVGAAAAAARAELKRLAASGAKGLDEGEPIACWSDAVQARFAAIEADS